MATSWLNEFARAPLNETGQGYFEDPFLTGEDPYGGGGYATWSGQAGAPQFQATPFWMSNTEAPPPSSPFYAAWLSFQSPAVKNQAPPPQGQQYSREGAGQAVGRDAIGRPSAMPASGQPAMYAWSQPGGPAFGAPASSAPGGSGGAAGGIPEGGWQAWFQGLTGGRAPSPGELEALLPELQKYGVKLGNKNAMGIADSIILPGGQVVDVGSSFSSGDPARMGWSWQVEDGSGGGAGGGIGSGQFTEGWTDPFAYDEFVAPDAFTAPTWTAPSTVDDSNDPGYTARLKAGEQAIQRSAAAKGTLLTGGTLKDLESWGQDYASSEYDKVYGREYGEYQSDYAKQWGEYLKNYENAASEWETGYNKALGEYQQRYGIFQNNQGNAFNRLMSVAQLGLGQQNSMAQFGQGYANNMANIYGQYGNSLSDLITGAGNANAAGQVGSGNAWASGMNGVANAGIAGMYGYQMGQNPGGSSFINDAVKKSANIYNK